MQMYVAIYKTMSLYVSKYHWLQINTTIGADAITALAVYIATSIPRNVNIPLLTHWSAQDQGNEFTAVDKCAVLNEVFGIP